MTPAQHPWWSTRAFACAMMALAMIPLLWPAIPPLVDLPGHMGRYAVQLAPADSPLHQWYDFQWAVIGNLGIDLLVIPLSRLFGLELAVKLVILAIPPLTVAGMLLVAREAHGDIPPTAAFALPLAYGFPFQFGFANFVLSMALALLGFAMWLRLGRTKRLKLRAALCVPFGIMLWFVHSFGWGVLGLLAFASDLVRRHHRGKPWIQSAWEAGLACLPLMPPILLMLLWRNGHVGGGTGDWFDFNFKSYFLLSILRNDGTLFDLISALFLIGMAAIGIAGFGFRRNPLLVLAGTILVATFVLLPRIVMGSAYADMRLAPYMIAILLLALTPRTSSYRIRSAIAVIAIGFFVVRIGVQTATYLRIDSGYRAQLEALDHVPLGSRIFALSDLTCLGVAKSPRLDHIEALGIVRRQSFVNGQWAMAGAQLLRVDYPEAKGYSEDPTQLLRPGKCRQPGSHLYPDVLAQFPRAAFDYLWLINFVPQRRPIADPGLTLVWHGPKGALYKIRRTPSVD